jgi:hypothetical protein
MQLDEAIEICHNKIGYIKEEIKYCKDKEHLKYLQKELEYNELIDTALNYFDGC